MRRLARAVSGGFVLVAAVVLYLFVLTRGELPW
jgi:hypothetical protein